MAHNQVLRGRLSLVQGDLGDGDIELARMTGWNRSRRVDYVAKLTGRLFVNSQLDSVSFLETVVTAMREHKLTGETGSGEMAKADPQSRPAVKVPPVPTTTVRSRQTILHRELTHGS